MRKSFLIVTLALVIHQSGYSDSKTIRLFKDYYFGESKERIVSMEGVVDCSESIKKPGTYCKYDFSFLKMRMDLAFLFFGNKLVEVLVATELNQEKHHTILGALNSKFELMAIENKESRFDMIEEVRKSPNRRMFVERLESYDRISLNNGEVKYLFIEKEQARILGPNSNNLSELILAAPNDLRAAEYNITTLKDHTSMGIIKFLAPKAFETLSASHMKKQSIDKIEDF